MAQDEYFLEGDEEAERLRTLHQIYKEAQGGRLVLAPVDLTSSDLTILDSGTSDGYWLFDLRKDVASAGRKHIYIGTDISEKRFPQGHPEDVSFKIQSINDAWPDSMKGSIDLVHQRLTLGLCGPEPKKVVDMMCELVRPGGWIQLIEAEHVISDDNGPAMQDFFTAMREMFDITGPGSEYPRKMEGWIKEAGFVNTDTFIVPSNLGAKVPNEGLREKSINASVVAIKGLVAYGKSLPFKSLTAEQLDTLPERFEEELRKQGGHYPLRAVWGQRPA